LGRRGGVTGFEINATASKIGKQVPGMGNLTDSMKSHFMAGNSGKVDEVSLLLARLLS
jgi:hypothetical protein